MQVVDSSSKSIEVAVIRHKVDLQNLTDEEVDRIVAQVEADKAAYDSC